MIEGEGDTIAVMTRAGWRFDPKTDGYRKGRLWVSQSQAGAAVAAAQRGESAVPTQGLSETFAAVIAESGLTG